VQARPNAFASRAKSAVNRSVRGDGARRLALQIVRSALSRCARQCSDASACPQPKSRPARNQERERSARSVGPKLLARRRCARWKRPLLLQRRPGSRRSGREPSQNLLEPIHLQLLAIPGARIEDLKAVYSHTHALGQCRNIIRRHKLQPVVEGDTPNGRITAGPASARSSGHW
jgi:Prephenate dehydratase